MGQRKIRIVQEEELEMKKLVLLLIVAIALPVYAADVILDYQDVIVDGYTGQCNAGTSMTSDTLQLTASGWWAFNFPLIRFDLSDAPAATAVDTVLLSLYCKTGSVPAGGTLSPVVGIQGPNSWDPYANDWDSTASHGNYYGAPTGPVWSGDRGTWTETGALWASRSNTHIYTYLPVSTGQYATIDITPLVVAWLDGSHANRGLYIGPGSAAIGGCPGADNFGNSYGSSEYAAGLSDPDVGPRLLFVPEPATMLLLLGGAATLIRRKK
jgi:hypothetical protein